MERGKIILYSSLIITLFAVINFGVDLTHHTHNSWMFYKMILEKDFLIYDPYLLLGEQITFSYGIITYPLAGLLWFITGYNTVDVMLFLMTIISFFLLKNLLKKDTSVAIILIFSIFHIMGDTLVAQFSVFLFWIGVYMFYKNKKFWIIFLLLACFNHPFTIIPTFYFILKDKKTAGVIITALAYSLVIAYYFTKTASLTFYLPLVFVIRTFKCLAPVFFIEDVFTEFYKRINKINYRIKEFSSNKTLNKVTSSIAKDSKKNMGVLKRFLNLKISVINFIMISCVIMLITNAVTVMLFIDSNLFAPRTVDSVKTEFFYGFPEISGILRVIDYLWLPSLVLNADNLTLSDGSFRENNFMQLGPNYLFWDIDGYSLFLANNSFDYVLLCRKCSVPNNEKEMLDLLFPIYWQNDYYYLYKIDMATFKKQ